MTVKEVIINKIAQSLIEVKAKGGEIIIENLILEVMKEALVTRRTAVEYIKIAKVSI